MNSSAASFRRSLKPLFAALLACVPFLASGQLPPANVLLTEPRPALLVFGPADIHLRVASSFIYDDNISLREQPRGGGSTNGIGSNSGSKGEPLGDDFIFTVSPGITIATPLSGDALRSKFSVDYSPSFIFFLRNDQENSIDHAVKAEGGYAFTKLTLGLAQSFSATAGGVVDVGTRVSQNSYQTAANARYEMTEKTFLQIDGTYRLTDYETLTDSDEWSVTPTVNYQISPKVTLGLGVTYGQLSVSDQTTQVVTNGTNTSIRVKVNESSQSYVGPTLRASYRTTEKTDISLSVGAEYRMYSDGSSALSPVFSLAGSYRPFEGTSFTIEGHRREQNSAVLNGANFISTGVSLSARQRLRERLFGTITASYDNADYQPARRDVSVTREDDYYLLRYGVEAIVGRSWTIGLFHQYREDISSDKSFSFSNNQVGIQAAWGR